MDLPLLRDPLADPADALLATPVADRWHDYDIDGALDHALDIIAIDRHRRGTVAASPET